MTLQLMLTEAEATEHTDVLAALAEAFRSEHDVATNGSDPYNSETHQQLQPADEWFAPKAHAWEAAVLSASSRLRDARHVAVVQSWLRRRRKAVEEFTRTSDVATLLQKLTFGWDCDSDWVDCGSLGTSYASSLEKTLITQHPDQSPPLEEGVYDTIGFWACEPAGDPSGRLGLARMQQLCAPGTDNGKRTLVVDAEGNVALAHADLDGAVFAVLKPQPAGSEAGSKYQAGFECCQVFDSREELERELEDRRQHGHDDAEQRAARKQIHGIEVLEASQVVAGQLLLLGGVDTQGRGQRSATDQGATEIVLTKPYDIVLTWFTGGGHSALNRQLLLRPRQISARASGDSAGGDDQALSEEELDTGRDMLQALQRVKEELAPMTQHDQPRRSKRKRSAPASTQ